MELITRIVRLFKADIHGIMDHLEDKDLLLKQHLREMEQALFVKEAELSRLTASRGRIALALEKTERETRKLRQDIEAAVKGGRDDIARMLLKRKTLLLSHTEELGRTCKCMDEQISRMKDCLKRQRLQYEQITHQAAAVLSETESNRWEESVSCLPAGDCYQEPGSEEIELELFRLKEAMKGGRRHETSI